MDDEFEQVFTNDDVEKITKDLKEQLKRQDLLIKQLQSDNGKLKEENESIKKQLQNKERALLQYAKDITRFEKERSEAIEKYTIIKEYQENQNLVDIIELFSWKAYDEQSQLILKQASQIEQLTQSQMQEQIPQRPRELGINEYKIFNDKSKIEEQENQIAQYQKLINQQNEAFKEKYFLTETIINYIDSLNENDKEKKIEEYINFGIRQFQEACEVNKIHVQISITNAPKK